MPVSFLVWTMMGTVVLFFVVSPGTTCAHHASARLNARGSARSSAVHVRLTLGRGAAGGAVSRGSAVARHSPQIFARRFPNQAGRPFADADGIMRSFSKSKSNGVSVYRGIQIKPDFMPSAEKQAKYGEEG